MRVKTKEDERVELYLDIYGAVLLKGLPGVGKTSLLEHIAKQKGWEVVFYQATPGSSEEELLYKLLPSDKTKAGVEIVEGALTKAARLASEGKEVLLILDEWDKTRPTADAFLLDFLQNRRISVPGFEIHLTPQQAENLKVGLTSNDMREFSEPLMRRVAVVELKPLRPEMVRTILEAKHPDNPYIDNAVRLYEITLGAGLSKPATVEELDRLLTAIERLGEKANWNTLIRELVVKDENDWEIFSRYAEEVRGGPVNIPFFEKEEEEPPMEAFEAPPGGEGEEKKEKEIPKLPRPIIRKPENEEAELNPEEVSLVIGNDKGSGIPAELLNIPEVDFSNIVISDGVLAVKGRYLARIKEYNEAPKISAILRKIRENISEPKGEFAVKYQFAKIPSKELLSIIHEAFDDFLKLKISQVSQDGKQIYINLEDKDGEIHIEGLLSVNEKGIFEGEFIHKISKHGIDGLLKLAEVIDKIKDREKELRKEVSRSTPVHPVQIVKQLNGRKYQNALIERFVEKGFISEEVGEILLEMDKKSPQFATFVAMVEYLTRKRGFYFLNLEIAERLLEDNYFVKNNDFNKFYKDVLPSVRDNFNRFPFLVDKLLGEEVEPELMKRISFDIYLFTQEDNGWKWELGRQPRVIGVGFEKKAKGDFRKSIFREFRKFLQSSGILHLFQKDFLSAIDPNLIENEYIFSFWNGVKYEISIEANFLFNFPKISERVDFEIAFDWDKYKVKDELEELIRRNKERFIDLVFKTNLIDGVKETTAGLALQSGIVMAPSDAGTAFSDLLKDTGRRLFKNIHDRDQNLAALLKAESGKDFVPFKVVRKTAVNGEDEEFINKIVELVEGNIIFSRHYNYIEYQIKPPDSPEDGVIVKSEEDAERLAKDIALDIGSNLGLVANNLLSLAKYLPSEGEMLRGVKNYLGIEKEGKKIDTERLRDIGAGI